MFFNFTDTKAEQYDTLLALGANQSNFCRMAAAAGIASGFETHLVLGGKKPLKATGNLLLDKLFGAVIHHVDSADWDVWEHEGKELSMWSGRIIGMGVAKNGTLLADQVTRLTQSTAEQLAITFNGNGVIVEDHYVGTGYAARTKDCDAAIELFAREEGILLDRVYTGKAAAGLIDYASKGVFPKGSPVLFIHTGGNIELFE